MIQKHSGHAEGGGVLLTGDPGIGKTSVVEMAGALLGIKVVVIEVPHITEEHLINIPFLVFNPKTGTTSTGNQKVDYKLVLADSNLFNQLTNTQGMSDAEYLKYITTTASKELQLMYKQLGGTEEKIPDIISTIRSQYKSILFLDELFRQTSTRIRNILRNILNGQIGMHRIPKTSYILYASNMRDTGLEEIPSNTEFQAIHFKTPSSKAWFDWFIAKFEDSTVQLHPAVIKKFKSIITDADMSHDDFDSEVRTSPRRWEQLLLYVNTSLPVEGFDDARSLITNIKNNFVNHLSGKYSKLGDKVIKGVIELIKETSNITVKNTDVLEKHDWREALNHHVLQQKKIGGYRKYIPVLSGPPGAGKTTGSLAVAEKHNMRFIHIDCSGLNAEDVIGMPIPGERNEESNKIKVQFSVPKLYREIVTKIKDENEQYIQELKDEYGTNAQQYIDDYKHQQYKYLILFDELNRVDERTFNALRRIILEKNFGPSGNAEGDILRLPEGSLVVGAMNPEGGGTSELTSHFRDVIDVIPVGTSWEKTLGYFRRKGFTGIDDEIKDAAITVIEFFVDKFKTKSDDFSRQEQPFHLDIGSDIYVSAREYTAMFDTLVRELHHGSKEILRSDMTEDEAQEEMSDIVSDALEDSLNFVLHKHGVTESEEFLATMKEWVSTITPKVFKTLISKQVKVEETWDTILNKYFSGKKDVKDMPNDALIVSRMNAVNAAQFVEEMSSALADDLKDPAVLVKSVIEQTHPKIELAKDTLVHGSEQVSRLENFILAFLYTLHLHGYQNDRIALVSNVLYKSISKLLNKLKGDNENEEIQQEIAMAIVQLRGNIHDIVQELD